MSLSNPLSGWLAIDKPVNMSSAKVVSIVKRCCKKAKVGHAGTLDPFATGVLPIAIGEATKTIAFAQDEDKEYIFTIKFGEQTDTLDPEGVVIAESNNLPNRGDVEKVLGEFIGTIQQTPPIFSALKVNGKRAYDLARSNVEFELKPRLIRIISLELLNFNRKNNTAQLKVCCGKGTYIRSLARDIANAVGSCGYVTTLRRTRVGSFCEKKLISLEKLEEIVHNGDLERELLSVDIVLDDILVLSISEQEASFIRNGKAVLVNHEASDVALVKLQNKPIALGNVENCYFQPTRVFNL